ncbi:hypothetical protein SLE2022_273470 [Rubroshorea leprosula]
MGCKFSCHSSPKFKSHVIRVVHLNGYVQAFENPVPVSQVTGNDRSGDRFLCTPAQLVSNCCPKPLQPDTILKPGHVYFLLPFSIFQSDISHLDLVSMAKKLNKKARCWTKSSRTTPLLDHYHLSDSVCKSPMRSPNRLSRAQPWKPILDTIREKSFTRRSESELQETADS